MGTISLGLVSLPRALYVHLQSRDFCVGCGPTTLPGDFVPGVTRIGREPGMAMVGPGARKRRRDISHSRTSVVVGIRSDLRGPGRLLFYAVARQADLSRFRHHAIWRH